MKRKKYSPEFKREAIELVRRSGASCRQVALEIGVAPICSHAGCERRNQALRKLSLEREVRGMRSLPASSASWPE